MNKYLSISIISLWILTLTGCLDEHPKDQLPQDRAYTSATAVYINTVASLYSYIGGQNNSEGLQGTYYGLYDYSTFTTDEAMIPIRGGDWYDGGYWENLYQHKWTASDLALKDTWTYLYKVISLCNRSLMLIDKHKSLLNNQQYACYQAEVRALRALYYYELIDLFGNVPVTLKDNDDLSTLRQYKRADVAALVVSELQDVAKLLAPEKSNQPGNYYGRITRPVAYFILAKIALNAEVFYDNDPTDNIHPKGNEVMFDVDGSKLNAWQTCVYYCNKITDAGYQLTNDYAANFAIHNEYSPENIFTIPMDKTLYTNVFKNLFRSRHYAHGGALGMDAENGSCATISTVKTYAYATDSIDSRYVVNFFSDTVYVDNNKVITQEGTPLVYYPLEVKVNLTGSPYEKTAGARMHKYEIDRSAYNDGQLQDNDIVLFRYADVLLMQAEALVRMGGDGSNPLNSVRTRAHMPLITATLNNILDERLRELMWEGWRRQDLIRFGRFCTAYDLRTTAAHEQDHHTSLMPIPRAALDLNKQLKQNPGYDKPVTNKR